MIGLIGTNFKTKLTILILHFIVFYLLIGSSETLRLRLPIMAFSTIFIASVYKHYIDELS